MGKGLSKVAKIYGGATATDTKGNKTEWLYDYANDKPRLESEMTDEEIKASEKAKLQEAKKQFGNEGPNQ